MSQIDRLPASLDCEKHFPDVVQRQLPRSLSDHYPMLLDCAGLHEGMELSGFRICGSNQKALSTRCNIGVMVIGMCILNSRETAGWWHALSIDSEAMIGWTDLSREIVWGTKKMHGNKAQGLDGFPIGSFQNCWGAMRMASLRRVLMLHFLLLFQRN